MRSRRDRPTRAPSDAARPRARTPPSPSNPALPWPLASLRLCGGPRLDLSRRYPRRRPGTSRRRLTGRPGRAPGPEANAPFRAYNTDADGAAAGAARAFAIGDEGGPYAGVTGFDLSP